MNSLLRHDDRTLRWWQSNVEQVLIKENVPRLDHPLKNLTWVGRSDRRRVIVHLARLVRVPKGPWLRLVTDHLQREVVFFYPPL